jgi:hypothetical protein
MNNLDLIWSFKKIFGVKILKFFDSDPGWKKFGSGRNIPDRNTLQEKSQENGGNEFEAPVTRA